VETLALKDADGTPDADALPVAVNERDTLADGTPDADALMDTLADGAVDLDEESDVDGAVERDDERLAEADGADGDADSERDGCVDADSECEADADADAEYIRQNGYGHAAGDVPHLSADSCESASRMHRPGELSSRKLPVGTLVSFVSDAGIGPVSLASVCIYLRKRS
jgi:hypothetical protein